ncbi:SubName: Full=Uncharacterized protein {ECO:0000313/EMBL:CCA67284.1} [Serendipita indica DSM 11827]|uniref:DUF2423 domain-containing protein n=1 Tax=Serendipita indica (strain DSM 11827) TaxID=1109443 RepID=G4T7F1_SERID|nr:SubName: Full=Uncharacterized protein {ECO:0000313/EMBL:CCA67284.1} [Serendipita indica DSM 11827]CCA67284.1 hypothetical protein PIIN_01117 [Serendipita indica DSM 11827]
MAKSTRSKTKRSFRRNKREDSVYAATHAARLERLSKKLADIAQPEKADKQTTLDTMDGENEVQGWPFFALLGLVDPDEIGAFGSPNLNQRPNSGHESDWLRGLSTVTWQTLSDPRLMAAVS